MNREHAVEQGRFEALLAAAAAIEHGQPEALATALQLVSPHDLLRVAARHRCLGYLRQGIVELGVRGERAAAFTKAVREYAGKAAIQAYAVRVQIEQLVQALNAAHVRFALLKGSARLFRGERSADYDTRFDLDILVPEEQAALAVRTLQGGGYHPCNSSDRSMHYWRRHHHAVPLRPESAGLPVEVHIQLAPRGSLSLPTDWRACETYLERVVTPQGEALCLNALGSAFHLAVHGLGLRRLHDVLLLAKLIGANANIFHSLDAIVAQERLQAVALQAVTMLAARVAGVKHIESRAVKRYLDWVIQRENLVPYVRDRSQFADAWFCNGGTVWGPATRIALPLRDAEQGSVSFAVSFVYQLVGRIATSAYALARVTTAPARRP